MSDEVGERTRELQDFEHSANTTEEFLNNKNLNPLSWRQRLARAVGIGAAATAVAGAVALNVHETEGSSSWVGEPIDPEAPLVEGTLHQIPDNQENPVGPFFHDEALEDAKELSVDEMKKRGFDITKSNNDVNYREVKGGTYSSELKAGQMEDEKGKSYGKWAEIYVGDKPTRIYVSENFVTPKPVEETANTQ